MSDILRRMVWFFILSCAFAYGTFLVVGSAIRSEAVDRTRIVLVRDVLKPNEHHLSGMVMAHTTCAQISLTTEAVDAVTYRLVFKTWETPSVRCVAEDTPRSFRTVVFAPAVGVHFVASLDDELLTLVVEPVVQ